MASLLGGGRRDDRSVFSPPPGRPYFVCIDKYTSVKATKINCCFCCYPLRYVGLAWIKAFALYKKSRRYSSRKGFILKLVNERKHIHTSVCRDKRSAFEQMSSSTMQFENCKAKPCSVMCHVAVTWLQTANKIWLRNAVMNVRKLVWQRTPKNLVKCVTCAMINE